MSSKISLFLSHYTYHLIGCLSLVFFIYLAVSVFLKKNRRTKKMARLNIEKKDPPMTITSQDIRSIAGEDVMVTQMDLARAYIELGKNNLAKKILEHVLQHGSFENKMAAKQLIANL